MRESFYETQIQPEHLQGENFIHPQDKQTVDAAIDGYKLPGIIDIHFHGAFGWDFVFGDPDKIEEMLDKTLAKGITGLFPTLITCPEEQRLRALEDIAAVAHRRNRLPLLHGIYLEGPFLAAEKRGSHPENCLMNPSMELLEKWQRAAGGLIKNITVAPELPGAIDFIAAATRSGVTVSLGHSNADSKATENAIAAGASHVTHLFNAMPAFHHRQPNLLTHILANRNLNIELIGDCEHVAPEVIKMIFGVYENSQITLVSDAVAPAGMPDGTYDLYNTSLVKSGNQCCLRGGGLFGGATMLIDCLPKLAQTTGLSWGTLGTSVWRNPCEQFKIKPPETEVFFDTGMNWQATRYNHHTWYVKA
jgi:N-acetylglucosamine-6-phosphate deacetylase